MRTKTKAVTTVVAKQNHLPAVRPDNIPVAPEAFPGERVEQAVDVITDEDVVQKYVRLLAKRRLNQVEAILAFSKHCVEAKETIPSQRLDEFYAEAEIGSSDFRKYVGIGRSNAFYDNPAIIKSLPTNYTILYQARHLQQKELERAIAEGVIRPNATRDEVENWVRDPTNCRYQPNRKLDEIGLAKNEGRAREVKALMQVWNSTPELVRLWRQSMGVVRDAFVSEIRKQKLG